jgi:peptidoglycan/xylan/chitin deacetylase (PgdA/CDA1 family)
MAGHQIVIHTWSHPELTTLSNEQVIAELGWSRKIIKDVLGVTPTMTRPPYGDIECVFFFSLHVCFDIKLCVLKTVTVSVTSLWP